MGRGFDIDVLRNLLILLELLMRWSQQQQQGRKKLSKARGVYRKAVQSVSIKKSCVCMVLCNACRVGSEWCIPPHGNNTVVNTVVLGCLFCEVQFSQVLDLQDTTVLELSGERVDQEGEETEDDECDWCNFN